MIIKVLGGDNIAHFIYLIINPIYGLLYNCN